MLATSSDCPVVIGDPLALEGLVSDLWPRLLPGMRRGFRFRLRFGPEESGIASVHIVAVPPVTVTRWPIARVIDLAPAPKIPRTAAGRFLIGEFKGDLCAFLAELSIDCNSFETLGLAARAFEISKPEPEFKTTLAALRLIGSLQPEPGKGTTIKKLLLDQLANHPGPTSVQEFLALRNLDLAPFLERSAFLDKTTEQFDRLFETDAGADALSPVAQSAFDPSQSTEDWRNTCRAALRRLSTAGTASVAPLVWMMLSQRAEVGLFLLEQVASVGAMDRAMAACLDEAIQFDNFDLSDALIAAGFVRAETAILINRHNSVLLEALTEACHRDRHRYGDGAVKNILELMEPAELVTAALAVDDHIVMSAGAAAVASAPTLLAARSLHEPQIQKVWSEALSRKDGAWRIRPNISALRNEVFDRLLGDELDSGLLAHLVSSPLGNALHYPRRADLWRALPGRCRDVCLASTAEAWATSLPDSVSQASYRDPEDELAIALASPTMLQKMKTALERLSFEQVLNVFTGNPQLPDALFMEVFATFYQPNRHPSGEDLQRAARLVAVRDWRDFTRTLFRRYGMTEDLCDFFHICADHLDFWDRLRHGIIQPSQSELYDFFVETACELYPSGPMDSEIWVRAGGNSSQLDVSGTGQRQWDAAIRIIRNGHQVRTVSLIAAMRGDYPLNHRLHYLAKECQ